ncbi:fatty acid desaturase 4, chloroplastic [Malania oleifera]|uniref:fatty acid desaturase 4, chloroplastic n=1 Tax=Malania oleifera TaxID=397392 RepID=UPI0025AE34AF|nr:fatty acid desaturase 4, chloroplastic [Malania oleifera]
MFILPQRKYPLLNSSSSHHLPTPPSHHPNLLSRRTQCHAIAPATATSTAKPRQCSLNRLDIDPKLPSPPTPVKTTKRAPMPDDRSLQSTWSHRAWVASGCVAVLIPLAKSVMVATDAHLLLEPILAGLVGYGLADLGSGVYHWAIDNYGDASTPVFGDQIEAFQGHHRRPWTIAHRQFANNLHALGRSVTLTVLPIDLFCNDPTMLAFVCVCSGCIMLSQQFHSWAHSTKRRLPPFVAALQDAGLLVSRVHHAAHHRPPYNNNYCIVSGVWNQFLDKQKVFEAMEMVVFFKLGVRPRSWGEPCLEWTQEEIIDPNSSS